MLNALYNILILKSSSYTECNFVKLNLLFILKEIIVKKFQTHLISLSNAIE